MTEKYNGKILKIFSQKGDWACILFEDNMTHERKVAKGKVTGMIYNGLEIELDGNEVNDPKYGKQIQIDTITIKESPTIAFLYKCVKGIGESLAKKIVDEYGDDCIDKIKKDPTILYNIKGIKKKKLEMITKSLNETEHIQLYLAVFQYFNNDVTSDQVDKIISACTGKIDKFEEIKKNPYWLIEHIDGFGFKKVDKLALASGIKEYSKERIEAAATYVLKYVSVKESHCFIDMNQLAKEVTDLILKKPVGITKKEFCKIENELLSGNNNMDEYISSKKKSTELRDYADRFILIIDLLSDVLAEAQSKDESDRTIEIDDTRIYSRDLYLTEVKLASRIISMLKKKPVKKISEADIEYTIHRIEDEDDIEYAPQQVEAIKNSLNNRLSLIVGGPGRGKTTIIKSIISCWDDDDNIVLLAPTGRAAKRMTEATGYKAMTIHRYRNEIKRTGNMPNKKLIILDETSMLGITLAETLFWLAEECNLILVGDKNQLPSIEPGNFLKDIIDSKLIPTTFLTVGFRNAGAIAINSELINEGKSPSSYIYDDTFKFTTLDKEEIPDYIVEVYLRLLKRYLPSEIGIISPIKVKGFGCVEAINRKIRERYNPATKENPDNPSGLRMFDRVMNIKNDYKRITIDELGNEEMGVFNGDTGTVDGIDYDEEMVEVLFDDGHTSFYRFSEVYEYLILAYAISIHKSQGSEYKALIVVVSPEYIYFMKRRMFYTAASRAGAEEELVGSKKAAALAAKNNSEDARNTYLKERLIQLSGFEYIPLT